jgi:hypothetical protein
MVSVSYFTGGLCTSEDVTVTCFEDSSDKGQCRIPSTSYYEGARITLFLRNAYWVVTWHKRFSARLSLNVDMEIRCQRCGYRTSRSSAWGCCILLGNSRVQISFGKPTNLTGFVCVIFPSLFQHMPGKCSKLGHNGFLPHPFHFIH